VRSTFILPKSDWLSGLGLPGRGPSASHGSLLEMQILSLSLIVLGKKFWGLHLCSWNHWLGFSATCCSPYSSLPPLGIFFPTCAHTHTHTHTPTHTHTICTSSHHHQTRPNIITSSFCHHLLSSVLYKQGSIFPILKHKPRLLKPFSRSLFPL
jgi:hypothetical protein